MQKKGTPAMNPKPGSQAKIGRKSEHPATETGVTEMQQTANQDETYPLTDTKQIPKHPATRGYKKIRAAVAVCGTDIRVWRKERDSNPRYSCPYTAFRVRPDRPLRQFSSIFRTEKPSVWDCKYRHMFCFSAFSCENFFFR